MKVKRNRTKNGKHRIELIFDNLDEMNDFSGMANGAYQTADNNDAEALLDMLYSSSYRITKLVPFDQSTRDHLNIRDEFPE